MRQERNSNWTRIVKELRDQYDDIAHQALPRRWVDLIHHLDEEERKTSDGQRKWRGTPPGPEDATKPDSDAPNGARR